MRRGVLTVLVRNCSYGCTKESAHKETELIRILLPLGVPGASSRKAAAARLGHSVTAHDRWYNTVRHSVEQRPTERLNQNLHREVKSHRIKNSDTYSFWMNYTCTGLEKKSFFYNELIFLVIHERQGSSNQFSRLWQFSLLSNQELPKELQCILIT